MGAIASCGCSLPAVQWTVAIMAALTGAGFDLATRRVPNLLSGTVLAGGLVCAACATGLPGLADAALGCVVVMSPFVLLFVFGGGGAGDAKLMGALGAWLGVSNGAVVLLCVFVSGGLMGVGFALFEKRLRRVLSNVAWVLRSMLFHIAIGRLRDVSVEVPAPAEMRKMPYGPAIFVGVCLAAMGVHLWRT